MAKACGVSKSICQILSSYGPSARVFEGIKMIEQVKIFKRCGNLYSFSFVSYDSVKILTSHFPCDALLQIRLPVSRNFKIEISLHATNGA